MAKRSDILALKAMPEWDMEQAAKVPLASDSARNYHRRRIARAIAARMTEGLRMIRLTPIQQKFASCLAKQRVAAGSNRSAKTTVCAIELARCFTNSDPHDKYPDSGQALVVGLDWQPHVAEMWRKMTQEGEFKIIPDEHTGMYRAVRPDPDNPTRLDPYDDAYREKWKDGAPLIPPRMIAKKNMESVSPPTPRWAQIIGPRGVWEVDFRSSKGAPVHGKHYNVAHFDEQLVNEQFYYEAMRGLVAINEPPQHTPRFMWSATSQVTNPQYYELQERALMGDPNVAAFEFLIKDMPFISDEEKRLFHDSLPEDERASRYHGIAAVVTQRIYGSFDPQGPHGCEPFDIPSEWARFGAVDPGRSYCATVFAAVPPDESHVYIYDAFVIKSTGAIGWAAEVAKRQHGVRFEAFVIDRRAGLQHGMGSEDDEGVAHKYWDALKEAGVQPRQMSLIGKTAGFFPGTDDVRAREESLRSMMQIRGAGPFAGTARLQLFRGRMPELEKQIRYAVMKHGDVTTRQKIKSKPEDLVSALEYLAHFDPGYYVPESLIPSPVKPPPTVLDAWKDQQRYERNVRRSRSLVSRF